MSNRRKARKITAMCHDCGTDTLRDEWYMVHDEVWQAGGLPAEGNYLCVGCLESRLGRRLRRADFTDAPINDLEEPFVHSARLQIRLAC